jgi:hypothetical protein
LIIQNDDWGKKGKQSMAAQLWSQTPGTDEIDDSKHYSEVSSLFSVHDRIRRLMRMTDVDGHVSIESVLLVVHGRTAG